MSKQRQVTQPPEFMKPGDNPDLDRNLNEMRIVSGCGDPLNADWHKPALRLVPAASGEPAVGVEAASVEEPREAVVTVVAAAPAVRKARGAQATRVAAASVAGVVVLAALGVAVMRSRGDRAAGAPAAAVPVTAEGGVSAKGGNGGSGGAGGGGTASAVAAGSAAAPAVVAPRCPPECAAPTAVSARVKPAPRSVTPRAASSASEWF